MTTAKDTKWDQGVSQLLGTLRSWRISLALLLTSAFCLVNWRWLLPCPYPAIMIGSHLLAGENKSLLTHRHRHNVPYPVTGPTGP